MTADLSARTEAILTDLEVAESRHQNEIREYRIGVACLRGQLDDLHRDISERDRIIRRQGVEIDQLKLMLVRVKGGGDVG